MVSSSGRLLLVANNTGKMVAAADKAPGKVVACSNLAPIHCSQADNLA
jgi:hypothetical protein